MPSNEQRRAAAKRKLERQLARRAEQEKKRKRWMIAGSVVGVVVVAAAVTGVYFLTKGDDDTSTTATSQVPTTPFVNTPLDLPGPPAPAAKPATVDCTYPATQGEPPAKPVTAPTQTTGVATTGPEVKVAIDSTQGPIGLSLNSAEAPCTVNSFVSLAKQGYFDKTSCHRIVAKPQFGILQCGDPTASGMGGPGYAFNNEYPTDLYPLGDPALQTPVNYKRGVIAMANAGISPDGTGTNGSQFFLVFGDTTLPPNYTIFGTIDEAGLKTLDKVAGAGTKGGAEDGGPAMPISFNSVKVS
ncbi:peptidylprolyl isomerase [Nocardia camponoti]|uniref:Peptidyl-prolyl cis-trans isomerase n=1 Tax=Nocardia camponoti TaxID=1616106 RepID=A0A917QAP3_9NOCA|nr:peptidylprolyl isomerase [Nocardia camponoti]GGK39675.1 peptidyl-prolyl cis-trans isomerase [Nocardia camponoti]